MQWHHSFYSKSCGIWYLFCWSTSWCCMDIYSKSPLLSLKRKRACVLCCHHSPEKCEKWSPAPKAQKPEAWENKSMHDYFLKSHDFSNTSLPFVGDLTHNFQKQTGSTADISKYFLSLHPPTPLVFYLTSGCFITPFVMTAKKWRCSAPAPVC